MDRRNKYLGGIVKALGCAAAHGHDDPQEYGDEGRLLLDAVLVVEELAKV